MQRLAVGIIGTGFGKITAQIIKALDPQIPIYLSGQDYQKTQKIAQEIQVSGAFQTWQEMVKDPKINLIVISSPSYLHKQMFEFAVKNNKHILLEKPAGITSKEIAEMENLTRNYSKLVVVNHEARFHPVVTYLKKLIERQQLGEILTIRLGTYLNIFTNPDYHGHWYNDKNQGGGQLFAIGVHQIDLARFLLNMPRIDKGTIHTKCFQDSRFHTKITAETQFTGQLITDSGVNINMYNDTYCFGYKDIIIEVIGSKGIALYSDTQGLRTSFANDQPLKPIKLVDHLQHINYGNSILSKAMKYLVKELLFAIQHNKRNPNFCSLKEARENMEILEKYKALL